LSPSPKLTEEEKQNGKRAVLIPSKEIQGLMQPFSYQEFEAIVKKESCSAFATTSTNNKVNIA
jgi:hypothetical protein